MDAEALYAAFDRLCSKQKDCDECSLCGKMSGRRDYCFFSFATLPYEKPRRKTSSLKPCPFCGGQSKTNKSLCNVTWSVRCLCCDAMSGSYDTVEHAWQAWNRRVGETKAKGEAK